MGALVVDGQCAACVNASCKDEDFLILSQDAERYKWYTEPPAKTKDIALKHNPTTITEPTPLAHAVGQA